LVTGSLLLIPELWFLWLFLAGIISRKGAKSAKGRAKKYICRAGLLTLFTLRLCAKTF
jgi:hypothetical protein